ncbi:hypothetical protein [Burkholderia cenocepacia]|uniref:hypothetical protein n=1 Tax=Burkholderia cenocepacia TaxID=95486 RepID=UPI002AC34CF6|nr:hypothetical protein [Burkholderia cenocepacia]
MSISLLAGLCFSGRASRRFGLSTIQRIATPGVRPAREVEDGVVHANAFTG